MSSPSHCRFSDSHEWYQVDGDTVIIGITQFAANELTDITYVEMQPVGTLVVAGESVGEVESVKTTSDIMSAFSGEITEINEQVAEDPSLLNSDPFGNGWLMKVRADDLQGGEGLMDQETYDGKYSL